MDPNPQDMTPFAKERPQELAACRMGRCERLQKNGDCCKMMVICIYINNIHITEME